MAQYWTDFSGDTIGSAPADWSTFLSTPTAFEVEADAGAEGGKALLFDGLTNTRQGASWDDIDSDANRDDVEILTRFKYDGLGTLGGAVVFGRGSGASSGTATAYYVFLRSPTEFRLARYVSGSFSALATGGTAPNAATDTYIYCRFQITGTTIRAKVWGGTLGNEPGTWGLTTTDSSITGVGKAGIWDFSGAGITYDWIGVGTNGDAAPSSAVGDVTLTLGEAVEEDEALPLELQIPVLLNLGEAVEEDEALPLEIQIPVLLDFNTAIEEDEALPINITVNTTIFFAEALEDDEALPLTIQPNIPLVLGLAEEDDEALPLIIQANQIVELGLAEEVDEALPLLLSATTTLFFNAAEEQDEALPLSLLTTVILEFGVAEEYDNALPIAINTGGSFDTGALNDAMRQYFALRGYFGDLNDQTIAWLQGLGATSSNLNDAWRQMLALFLVSPSGNRMDDWRNLLAINGFSQGALNDRELAFFLSNADLVPE